MRGRRDFLVVQSEFVAVSVKLQQGTNETKIVYTGLAPRWWARFLMAGGLLMIVVFYAAWNSLTNDVKQLIETAPEFK